MTQIITFLRYRVWLWATSWATPHGSRIANGCTLLMILTSYGYTRGRCGCITGKVAMGEWRGIALCPWYTYGR